MTKRKFTFCGVVSNIREVTTKKKDIMAYVTIEDLKGSITVIFFADIYKKAYPLLHGEEPVLIKGSVDVSEEGIKIIASDTNALATAIDQPFVPFISLLTPDNYLLILLEAFKRLLGKHSGKADGFHSSFGRSKQKRSSIWGRAGKLEPSSRLKKKQIGYSEPVHAISFKTFK